MTINQTQLLRAILAEMDSNGHTDASGYVDVNLDPDTVRDLRAATTTADTPPQHRFTFARSEAETAARHELVDSFTDELSSLLTRYCRASIEVGGDVRGPGVRLELDRVLARAILPGIRTLR